jgi:hypothetical protein
MTGTTVAPAARRTRPLVAALGAILAAGGAFILPFLVYAAKTTDTDSTAGIDFVSDIILVWFGLVPLGLGLWLLYIGAPALAPALRARAAALASRDFWQRAWTWARSWSIGRTVLAAVVTIAAALVLPRGTRWLAAFAALMSYSVADPLLNAFRPRWWIHTAQSLAGWLVLFVMSAVLAEIDHAGEGGMLFIAPVMLYPAAIGLGGLLRFAQWLRQAPDGS